MIKRDAHVGALHAEGFRGKVEAIQNGMELRKELHEFVAAEVRVALWSDFLYFAP